MALTDIPILVDCGKTPLSVFQVLSAARVHDESWDKRAKIPEAAPESWGYCAAPSASLKPQPAEREGGVEEGLFRYTLTHLTLNLSSVVN